MINSRGSMTHPPGTTAKEPLANLREPGLLLMAMDTASFSEPMDLSAKPSAAKWQQAVTRSPTTAESLRSQKRMALPWVLISGSTEGQSRDQKAPNRKRNGSGRSGLACIRKPTTSLLKSKQQIQIDTAFRNNRLCSTAILRLWSARHFMLFTCWLMLLETRSRSKLRKAVSFALNGFSECQTTAMSKLELRQFESQQRCFAPTI